MMRDILFGELTVESPQHLLGGFDAVVLGFLEDGNAAQVGVGEEDSVIQALQSAAFFGKDGANGGTNQGGGQARYIKAGKKPGELAGNSRWGVRGSVFPR